VQSLKALLNDNLLRQARLFEAMTESLRMSLPPALAAHCWVGGIRDRVLVVITDSANFTIAVHYQQHEILKRINGRFRAELSAPLIKLKTKVAKVPTTPKLPLQPPQLSAENGRTLAAAAAHIIDPDLRSALTRLARRGDKQ
jgi:hypothetical protein